MPDTPYAPDAPKQSLLQDERIFAPPADFTLQANYSDTAVYDAANADRETFWRGWADKLAWITPYQTVCEWNPPHAKWFTGGTLNASANCLDRHIETDKRNKAAIIFEGEPGDQRVLTYYDLWRETNRFANVLKKLGVGKGDRVTIYLPMIPEAAIAMLACARIGAIHTVVFGGFSADSLRERINDSESKVVVTADGGYRRGSTVNLKAAVDTALDEGACPSVTDVVVYNRLPDPRHVPMTEGRDHWWHRLMETAPRLCDPEPMDSEDPLYILYTSGSTGKPKGILHTTAGYLTQAMATFVSTFDNKNSDVFWCTADVGWVTGHSYVVYGPLAAGATVLMYEGAPDFPTKSRFWEIIEKYGVTVFYTAPTAIRAFMKWGTEHLEKHDLSSLRLLGSVGEPINPEAWMWYHKHVGGECCPIADTWWQTETGGHMVTPLPGIVATKPGSATFAFPGVDVDIVDENGETAPIGTDGFLVVKSPWPGMLRTLWRDDDRYKKTYWSKFGDKNLYFAGDGARRDADGYIWLLGRVDDIMLVAGHNISTMEVESALVSHPAVAEAAVIGRTHDIKGQAVAAFVTVK
ncbi:MAG: acetate--CoA ligase, partial [Armatimonadetes bacterium]|nr:acetate--CoA ligase [Armatimonadota bacterium]